MTSALTVTPTGAALGAVVTGIELSQPLDAQTTERLRRAWLDHLVLVFPEQRLGVAQLEAFSQAFGPFGDDPFIAPMAEHPHVIEVKREAHEKASVFAAAWHSDWSFQDQPPVGTVLYSRIIPPVGGDTLFCNGYLAYERLPETTKARIADMQAVHSAALAYAPAGVYGANDGPDRSMSIRPSAEAERTRTHPVVKTHPETGRKALFVNPGYVRTIEGLSDEDAFMLLCELYEAAHADDLVYRHRWEPDMLVMWDNRCTQHMATGGYDGHARLLWRTTIADQRAA